MTTFSAISAHERVFDRPMAGYDRHAQSIGCIVMSLTVWHDGGCPLCRSEIALMRRLDRRNAITFIDASDGASICPRDRRELLARFHAAEDGHMLTGAAAFAAMWRAIPLLRPLGLVARNRHLLRALDWLYERFLTMRPRLQHLARRLEKRTK